MSVETGGVCGVVSVEAAVVVVAVAVVSLALSVFDV